MQVQAESYDKLAGRLFSIFLIANIMNIVVSLIGIFSSISNYATVIFALVYATFLLMHQRDFGRTWRLIIILEFGFAAMYIVSALLHNNFSADLVSRMYWSILYCIPLGGIWYYVEDADVAIEGTRVAANFSTICALIVFCIFVINKSVLTSPDYSMGLGYALLYPTLFHIKESTNTIKYLFYSILDLIILMCYGSRSQLLCVMIFLFFFFLFRNPPLSRKGFLFLTLCASVAVMLAFCFKSLLKMLINFLGLFGIYSRSLGYFLERTTYTGRETVWKGAVKLIMDKPVIGWGIGLNTSLEAGCLPHNVYLEFCLHYGIPLGGIVCILLTIIICKGVFSKRGGRSEGILILFVTGFVPLLLSSSYLIWPQFWIFFMICCSRVRRTRETI